jgi:hypothetical protein
MAKNKSWWPLGFSLTIIACVYGLWFLKTSGIGPNNPLLWEVSALTLIVAMFGSGFGLVWFFLKKIFG